jgi:hypothetical protein
MDWISFFAGVGTSAAFAAVATVFILKWAQKGIESDNDFAQKRALELLDREKMLIDHWCESNKFAEQRNEWLEKIAKRLGA